MQLCVIDISRKEEDKDILLVSLFVCILCFSFLLMLFFFLFGFPGFSITLRGDMI